MASRNRRKPKSLQARTESRSGNIHFEHMHFVGNAGVSIKEVPMKGKIPQLEMTELCFHLLKGEILV